MTDKTEAGLVPYSGPKAGRPGPRDVLALIEEKCRLRALLEEQQSRIEVALPHLDQQGTEELLRLMAIESSDSPDIVRVQEEVVQAAAGIQPMDVRMVARSPNPKINRKSLISLQLFRSLFPDPSPPESSAKSST